jgi:serine/threonine protein kinase
MPLSKIGKYERVDVLGHGASGIVYLAWDTLLKKQIALKEIDLQASDISRFLEEARVLDRLRHDNIVRVNGVDLLDGHIVIDMEYVKGMNLQELLRREGRLPVERSLSIAIQTLDALAYAHRNRTVHRDIKPANILIGPNSQVKLVDFGLAEILATNSYAGGAGTYAYMAPEDFAEEHHSDHQSDIWAAGVTLYEMVTGARPFTVAKAKDPFAWRRTLLSESPTLMTDYLDNVPEGLQQIMDRALARDKKDRYSDAGAFRDDLKAIQNGILPVHAYELATVSAGLQSGQSGSLGIASIVPPIYPRAPERTIIVAPIDELPSEPQSGESPRRRFPSLIRKKETLPARVMVEPNGVFFGDVRKGDHRSAKVLVKLLDGSGKQGACVAAAPAWAVVNPTRIERRKQVLTITANSENVWQTGEFSDTVKLDTEAGRVEIPVSIRVLPSRLQFNQIAVWFVPVFICTLLPTIAVAYLSRFTSAHYLVPAAALGSCLLATMLMMVCSAADLGIEERVATGIVITLMATLVGIAFGVANRTGHTESVVPLFGTGVPFGATLLLQLITRRHWKLWAGAIALLSLLAAGTFTAALSN